MNTNMSINELKEALDRFPVPVGSHLVLYKRGTRTANFYKKTSTGYVLRLTRNKRHNPIRVRKDDFLLTMDFNGGITAGDPVGVFERC